MLCASVAVRINSSRNFVFKNSRMLAFSVKFSIFAELLRLLPRDGDFFDRLFLQITNYQPISIIHGGIVYRREVD